MGRLEVCVGLRNTQPGEWCVKVVNIVGEARQLEILEPSTPMGGGTRVNSIHSN